jgi:DNA-binding IclR family transcriptional regulator
VAQRSGHPAAEPPNDLVRSVSRAFRVLEAVGANPAPLTVKAIARRSQLNLSTTYHLVRTLEYERYLEREPDGRYRLGESVAFRFRDLLSSFRAPPEVHQVLRHVAATTRRSGYLGRFGRPFRLHRVPREWTRNGRRRPPS